MSEEYSFVQQIRQDPHDDVPRLIFADYLEDAGDPQGELIRVQVELAKTPVGDSRRPGLVRLNDQLLAEHGETWLAQLRALGAEGISIRCFQRGLVERVRIQASRFLENGEELCRIAPALYCLELRGRREQLPALENFPMPPQITSLDVSANRLQDAGVANICIARWLGQLEELNLGFNRIGHVGLSILTNQDMPNLKRLWLGVNQIGPDGAAALGAWPDLAHLEALSLPVNQLGDDGIRHLTDSLLLSNLQRLDLASNGITGHGVRHLALAKSLTSLKVLNLRSNQIDTAGMGHLVESSLAGQLTVIDVRGNQVEGINQLRKKLGDDIVCALA